MIIIYSVQSHALSITYTPFAYLGEKQHVNVRQIRQLKAALISKWPMKGEALKSADNQQLPTAPSWLDGMCGNVMVNGNQSKLLGLGAVVGPEMEENERENEPLISVKTDPRPADTATAMASSRGSNRTSVRAGRLGFHDLSTEPRFFFCHWVSERNIKWLWFYWRRVRGEIGWKKVAVVNEMKAVL